MSKLFVRRYQIYDLFELFSGIFALVASSITIISAITKKTPKLYLLIVALLLVTAMILLKFLKFRSLVHTSLNDISVGLHNFTHGLRNESLNLKLLPKEEISEKLIFNTLKSAGQNTVSTLSNIMTTITGEVVNACIKWFPEEEKIINSSEDWDSVYVQDLCRSKKDSRHSTDFKHKIIENTDFSKITLNNKKIFAESNLEEYDFYLKKHNDEYQNTNKKWSKYYKATIVAPIRYKNANQYDFLGFLCVDSLSTSAFRKDQMETYKELVKGFADGLYSFFYELLELKKNIRKRGKK